MPYESKLQTYHFLYEEQALNLQNDYHILASNFLNLIHHARPDLSAQFDISEKNGITGLISWYLFNFYQIPDAMKKALLSPANNVVQDQRIPIINAAMLIKDSRPDLRKLFHLNTPENRQAFLLWWLNAGLSEYALFNPENCPDIKKSLYDIDSKYNLPKIIVTYHSIKANLKPIFDLENKDDKKELLEWWQNNWELETPNFPPPDQIPKIKNIIDYKTCMGGGFNIIGYPRSILGIGEDARMAALSMEKEDIPYKFHIPDTKSNPKEHLTIDNHLITKKLPHKHNLFCIPATESALIIPSLCKDTFLNSYNIGAWQWELPHWPKEWNKLFSLMDEIWAFSQFAKQTFESSSPTPVTYMPMCVEYPNFSPLSRSFFQLPEEKFLFLIMFDSNSGIARKNPFAAINAFTNAFSSNPNVGLVIKTMNMDGSSDIWKDISNLCKKHSNIHFINKIFNRDQSLALINACDAYVSLHRAEGFGRIIAESMLLEKPVITTNFSGNTDFSTPETAFMVNGPLVPLKPGDYSVWENQFWCDPDVDEATERLIACFKNVSLRKQLAKAGKAHIEKYHSAEAVGKKYKKALKQLSKL